MITLHYLPDSRSQRILWMLEEIGVDYQVRVHPRTKTRRSPASLKAIHPVGKGPVLTDGDRVVAESGHIVEYLAERHAPHFFPEGDDHRLEHRYWMHFAEATHVVPRQPCLPPLIMEFLFELADKRTPWFLRPVFGFIPAQIRKAYLTDTIDTLLGFVNTELAGRDGLLFGDEPTCADVMMSFPLEAVVKRRAKELPHIKDYVDRIQARPAYQRAQTLEAA